MRYVCIGSWGISFFTLTQLHTDGGISKKKWNFFFRRNKKKLIRFFYVFFSYFLDTNFYAVLFFFFFAFLVLEFIFHEKNRYSTPFFSLLNGLLCHFSTLFFTTQNFIFFMIIFFQIRSTTFWCCSCILLSRFFLSFLQGQKKNRLFFLYLKFFSYIIKYIRLFFA